MNDNRTNITYLLQNFNSVCILIDFLTPKPLFPNSTLLRYGNDAGQATDTALKSVANVGVTAYNIDNLGIKAIMKTTGKATAKAMVKSPDGKSGAAEREEEQTQENQVKTEEKKAQKKEEEEKEK